MHVLTAADFAPAATPPALGEDEIHLWYFPHWEKTREAADAPVVRALLAGYLGVAAQTLRIARGEHGKPWIDGAALQFNASHTGNVLLLALSRAVAVGVDLEARQRRTRAVPELAQRWFTPGEAQALAAQPEAVQQEAFLRLWTCKEAVLKCSGRGIGGGLDGVEFELSARAQVCGVRNGPDWQLLALEPDAAHLGALAWRGKSVPVRGFVTQTIAAAAQSG